MKHFEVQIRVGQTVMKLCIVTTTINSGDLLDRYCDKAESDGMTENLRIIVVPDRRSSNELYERCKHLR